MKVIRLNREKIYLCKVAKIHRRLYVRGGGGGGGVAGGEQVCARPPPSGKRKISRLWGANSSLVFKQMTLKLGNFTTFKTFFPVVSLDCPCLKLKKKKKRKKMVWSVPKEVHFWAAPPSIGNCREPLNAPRPPPPLPLSRYKMWEFQKQIRHTNTRHVKACLAGT